MAQRWPSLPWSSATPWTSFLRLELRVNYNSHWNSYDECLSDAELQEVLNPSIQKITDGDLTQSTQTCDGVTIVLLNIPQRYKKIILIVVLQIDNPITPGVNNLVLKLFTSNRVPLRASGSHVDLHFRYRSTPTFLKQDAAANNATS